MARTIATIKEAIRVQKNLYSELAVILFAEEDGSKVGILNNIADNVAININILEQLQDAYKAELELIADSAVPGTSAWLQEKVLEFQYSTDTPQYVQLIDLIPTYNVIDETLRIISRAAIRESGNGRINVKVATAEPPVSLDVDQQTALAEYLDIIGPAGPQITISSLDSDKLYIDAEVFYDGQFVNSIKADVEAAINNYLGSLDFDGVVLISKIQDSIQAVTGVRDVIINEVRARKDSTPFSGASTITRIWETVAGYIVEETDSGHTFDDTIIYSAQ